MKALAVALLGAISGALAVGTTNLLPLGDAPGVRLFGHCFGLDDRAGRCVGTTGGLYLFPGLIFGLGFAIFLGLRRQLGWPGAALLAVAATLANAAAVFVFAGIFVPVSALLKPITAALDVAAGLVMFGVPAAIAGALGGGLLGFVALRLLGTIGWLGVTATAAALGPLLNLVTAFHGGEYPFYILWQAGYAAVLFTRRTRVAPTPRPHSSGPAPTSSTTDLHPGLAA